MGTQLTPSWQVTFMLSGGLLGLSAQHITGSFFIETILILGLMWLLGSFARHAPLGAVLRTMVFTLVLFWVGVWRMSVVAPAYDAVAFLPQQEIVLKGVITDYRPREETTQLVLNHVRYGEESRSGKVLLTIQRPLADWQVGDQLLVSCRARVPEQGSYQRYLEAQNIYITCLTREEPVHMGRSITPQALAWRLRENFEGAVRARFSEPYATLLTGLYIGDVFFSEQYQDIFKATGISHIVAASGSNVSLTVVLVLGALAAFGVRRQDTFWWIVLAILSFVVISGMSAPVIRAGVMGTLVLMGRTFGRTASMRNVFLLTITVLLFARPLWLFYDIGFQLSVGSTWGLLYLSGFFKKVFSAVPEIFGVQEAISTTMAATIATAPILILSFGQFSILSPVANLLILPALPYVMLTGAAALLAPVRPALIALPWLGLEWMLRVSELIGSLTAGMILLDHMVARIALAAVFICLTIAIYLKEQRSRLAL